MKGLRRKIEKRSDARERPQRDESRELIDDAEDRLERLSLLRYGNPGPTVKTDLRNVGSASRQELNLRAHRLGTLEHQASSASRISSVTLRSLSWANTPHRERPTNRDSSSRRPHADEERG